MKQSLIKTILKHPLIHTLTGLRGNPRACVYTEPMWGLSVGLCAPYASVFMLALGIEDERIGLISSIYMLSQVVFAFLSGVITDKLGRRKATPVFDFLAWSVPCLIWAFAQNFWFFLVAALLNGMMMVPTNSWDCLLVEDADKSQITHIYSWVIICGHLSAFFAPISSVLVSKLTLIPAVRILYVNAFIVMTLKIFILYKCSTETQTGLQRMKETRGKSITSQLGGYDRVLRIMSRSGGMKFAVAVTAIVGIARMVGGTFWPIIVSQKLEVPDRILPLFPMIRSFIALVFFFTIIARINQLRLKNPLLIGFTSYLASQVFLLLAPTGGWVSYAVLVLSLLFEGFGTAILATLAESLVAIHADTNERARMMAILHLIVMLISAPFGWIGGLLSGVSRDLPFILIISLLAAGFMIVLVFYSKTKPVGDDVTKM